MSQTFTYKTVNGLNLHAELFPTEKKAAPLIVYIHGGGLIWGTRNDINKEQVRIYQSNGFHVLSIAYRLAPETKLPEIITDIQDAFMWVKEELPDHLDFDSDKVIAVGSSAGGYLALMTGTFTVRPDAIVSFYGYGDIRGDWYSMPSDYFNKMPAVNQHLAHQLIRKEQIAEAPITARYAIYLYCRQQGVWPDFVLDPAASDEELRDYCPIIKADEQYPRTLLLHGDADEDVPYEESVRMHDALKKLQVDSKLITITGGKHQFDEKMDDPQVKDAFEEVLTFLKSV